MDGRKRPRFLVPPVYFLMATALIVLVARLVPESAWPPLRLRWVAWIPAAMGLIMFVPTVIAFKRTRTPLRPLKEKGQLMTGGMFRISRNPIYLAMTLLLISFCLRLQAPVTLVMPFLFAAVIQNRIIRLEEAFLTENFGDAYLNYRARVRRWL